jgi:hypothetical protein
MNGYQFLMRVTNTHGSTDSNPATLTVVSKLTPIPSVSLTVTTPIAGAKPDFNPVLPSGVGYEVGYVAWFDETDEHWMDAADPFATGHDYMVRVSLMPKSGYAFNVDASAKVNGFSARPELRDSEDGDYMRVQHTFTVKEATVKIGDVNQDSEVNATDRMILSRYLAGWEGYKDKIKSMDAADIDRNGTVEAKDRMLLARKLAGWSGYDSYFN